MLLCYNLPIKPQGISPWRWLFLCWHWCWWSNGNEYQKKRRQYNWLGYISLLHGCCRYPIDSIHICNERGSPNQTLSWNSSCRSLIASDRFSLLWNKETEEGNGHIVYRQIFVPDERQIVYASRYTLNALDYLTGNLLWLTIIPEDATFHLYQDHLFALARYDPSIPFAPEENLVIPPNCNSPDVSTMHVYDPYNGNVIWEYSYHMASLGELYLQIIRRSSMDRETRQPIGMVEFSGSELNPFDVQIIIRNNLLAIYLEDSRQFFVFQMK